MCLYTRWKKPKVAAEDIVVYKVLCTYSEYIESPYRNFVYNLKELYETKLTKCKSLGGLGYNIFEGFHAFVSKKPDWEFGIHEKLYKCIIPKGSTYYISSDHKEIVADKIIIKRKLWFNKF